MSKENILAAVDDISNMLDWNNLKHGDYDVVAVLMDLQVKMIREVPKLMSKLDVESKSSPQAKASRDCIKSWEGDMNSMPSAIAALKAATTIN